jgi:hypothetical protein
MPTDEQNLREIIKQEYAKCAVDIVYFIKKYCRIQHQTRGRIFFELYPFQERTLIDLMNHRYNIILKSRQLGISTLVAAYALWLCIFHDDKNVLVIATKEKVAKALVTKVRIMYGDLPVWIKKNAHTTEDNKLSIKWKNGSQVQAETSSPTAGRSDSCALLILDECAFIDNINEIWASAQQTLGTGGDCIMLSTPNGIGNIFHRQWVKAEAHETKFNPIKLKWDVHPERDLAWRQEQDELLGPKLAAQECFSGDTLIHTIEGLTPIKEITEGDIVLTHLGNYKKVIKKVEQTSNKYYEFNTSKNHKKRKVTSNHPFYTFDNEWKSIEEINDGDKVCSFIYVKENERTHHEYTVLYKGNLIVDKLIEVYNLEVEDDHSYITEHVVCHNCDTSFESSGNTLVEFSILEFYEQTYVKEPIEKRGIDQALWIWDYPDYNKQYLVAADVARGDGTDYSAFHVIDVVNLVQVAEFRSQIPTKDYGHLLVNIATEYNNALLVIENANVGWAAIQVAVDRQYPNLFYSYKDSQVSDVQSYLNKGYDLKSNEDKVPGFTTSTKTRPLLVSKIELLLREKLVVIQSKRTIEELKVFIWLNNKAQAAHGYNDDLVLSLGIGLWIRDTAVKLMSEGVEINRKTLELFNTSNNYYGSVVSTGGNVGHYGSPLMKNWNINNKGYGSGKNWNGNSTKGDDDLSWLY